MDNLHIWTGSIDTKGKVLEQHMLLGRPCIFQQDSVKPHPASIASIVKHKIQQRRPRTADQLESSIRQEWDNNPLPKVQQLVSSVPDVYRCC